MSFCEDSFFMERALELAKQAWGKTNPNPMVGAVIVKNSKIIGEGFHQKDGEAHAEINALNSLMESAGGATMYVTLEPCSTKGRTGACTDAIIKSGISKVVIASLDPNPNHAGKALEIFKNANIETLVGVKENEAKNLNFIFNFAIQNKTALLALKYAQTKNKKIAEVLGAPSKITGDAARAHLMRYRKLFAAIAVGFKTMLADNPSLSARIEGSESANMRLLFDRQLNSAKINLKTFKLFSDSFADKTFVVCDADSPENLAKELSGKGVKLIKINAPRANEKLFWHSLKKELFKMGVNGLMLEGGAQILSSAANANEADFIFEYTSPKIFSNSAPEAFSGKIPQIKNPKLEILGEDTCLSGFTN